MGAEEQELTLFTDSVNSSDLKPGAVYFRLLDTDPLPRDGGAAQPAPIPAMVPLVFLVRSEGATGEELHFQDAGAHAAGVRRDSGVPADEASFHRLTEEELGSIFVFERALEELMRCSLRRSESERTERAQAPESKTLRFQFDDAALQARLAQELVRDGVAHASEGGWLIYRSAHAQRFELCVRRVREQLFPWYSRSAGQASAELVERLCRALADAAFLFALERDDAGAHFILPRVYRELHAPIFARFEAQAGKPPAHSLLREPLLKDVIPLRRASGGARLRAEVVVGRPAPLAQAASAFGCPIEIDGEPAGVMTLYGSGAHDSRSIGLQIIKRLRNN